MAGKKETKILWSEVDQEINLFNKKILNFLKKIIQSRELSIFNIKIRLMNSALWKMKLNLKVKVTLILLQSDINILRLK